LIYLHRFDGLSEEVKDRLRKTYESLNPAFLKRNIDRHKREIERAYEMKMEKRKKCKKDSVNYPII
jgi:hypothetical protein